MEASGSLHPYGTALPSLDEDTTFKEKPARVEDQIVTDENGKRRFHGAFTGGFSAGYWNTVGSQEGWTPQTFKSSRAEKATRMQQKPTDFMDDEDLGEFGIAPQRLQVREEYGGASSESRKRKLQLPSGFGGGSSDVLNNIFQPVRTTVGVKILKSMGWRPGQGIGARQTKKEKKEAAAYNKREMYVLQHYGCTTSSKTDVVDIANEKEDLASSDDDIDDEITFAPDDYDAYDSYLYKPKENYFGLGYSGLSRESILSDGKAGPAQHINLFGPLEILGKDNKKLSITGQGFGVGALEEEDDDIYQRDDMTKYDFTLEEKKHQKRKRETSTKESIQDAFVLEGFIAETKNDKNVEEIYEVELAKNWKPRNWAERKTRFSPLDEKQLRALEKRRRQISKPALTPTERTSILESTEAKTPIEEDKINLNKVKEKFAKRDDRTKELLELISAKSSGFVRGGIIAIDGTEQESKELTKSSQDVAAKDGSFQPFAYDDAKQKRYDDFIAANVTTEQDITEYLKSIQPLHLSEWDREMEKKEFIQARKLYKPLEGLMANRFISETSVKAETTVKEIKKIEDRVAVIVVRTKTVWKPASLLCKRYNIAEPFGGGTGGADEKQQRQKKAKLSVFDYLEGSVNSKSDFITPVVIPKHIDNTKEIIKNAIKSQNQNTTNTRKNVEINEPSTSAMATTSESIIANNEIVESGTHNDALRRLTFVPKTELEKRVVQTRDLPIEEKRDIFKSIFEDSDDDNADDVGEMTDSKATEVEKQAVEEIMINTTAHSAASVNLLRNTSPPRGIFAALFKINTNEIEEDKIITIDSTKDDYEPPPKIKFVAKGQRHDDESVLNVESNKETVCENVYGPAIPTSLLKTQSSKETLNDNYTANRVSYKGVEIVEQWVEKKHNSSLDSDDSSSSSSSSKKKQKKSKKSKKSKKTSVKKTKKSKKKKGKKEKEDHKSAKSKKR